MKKDIPIFDMRQVQRFINSGFKVRAVHNNKFAPGSYVFFFENTAELRDILARDYNYYI